MALRSRGLHLVRATLLVAVLSSLLVVPAWGRQPERVKVLIGLKARPGPAEVAMVRGLGGTVRYAYDLVPAIAATLPDTALTALQNNPNVVRVEADALAHAVDIELDNAWGVKRIGAGTVHDGGNKGTGVSLAVIDSGVDCSHPELDGNCVGGYDFVDDDPDPADVYGHGTHVAGTACGEDNDNGSGIFGVVGVAPECDLYSLRVLNAAGSGYASDIIAAMQWAVDNGMQVANLSLGFDRDPGAIVKAAFDAAWDQGIVTVAAAGNSGNPPGKGENVIFPAAWDSAIAVAATDSRDRRATFSSTGDAVELAAPGVSVFSTWNDADSPYDPQPVCHPEEGQQTVCYKFASGTSMASPHVAGTAALVIAAGITDANGDNRINDEVRQRLNETADDLGSTTGWDPLYGFGLVNAAEAAEATGPTDEPPIVSISSPDDGASFDPGATINFVGQASDAEDGDLTDSLVWTLDLQGQIGSGGTFSAILTDGDHTITASATDSAGQTASASIDITVGTPPAGPAIVSVTGISYTPSGGPGGDKHLSMIITLADDLGNAVASASVSYDVKLDEEPYASGTGITGSDGTLTVKLANVPVGCYDTTVVDVTAAGLTWNSVTPDNTFCKEP